MTIDRHFFWANLGRETWPDRYHPVTCHLADVAAVALRLWQAVLRPRVPAWVAARRVQQGEPARLAGRSGCLVVHVVSVGVMKEIAPLSYAPGHRRGRNSIQSSGEPRSGSR